MAKLAAGLLRGMQRRGPVHALVENPYRTQAGLVPGDLLRPLCDLPLLRQEGQVDVPLYLVGNDLLHLHQLRYVRMVPGLLVLPDLDLSVLRAGLQAEIGGQQRPLYHGFEQGDDFPALLASMSQAVVVATEEQAAHMGQAVPGIAVHVVPELLGDAEAAGDRLWEIASGLPPIEQSIRPEANEDLPSVTAVVIGYNSKDIVGPCLQTLLDQDYPNLEVVVVDNASQDGTADFIREKFPSIRLIASQENLGFAEGNNLVFRESRSKYIALLNQDAYAKRNWVTELVRCAELDDSIGSVGSKMLMDRCPTLINSTAIEINEAGWGWDRQVGEKDENPSPMPEEVFGGCGGGGRTCE